MIKQFYRKLYLYIILISFIAIIVTLLIADTFFRYNQKNLLREHLKGESSFIVSKLREKFYLSENLMFEEMRNISDKTLWNISYWKNNKLVYFTGEPIYIDNIKIEKLYEKKEVIYNKKIKRIPEIILFLDEKKTENGYIAMRFNFSRLQYPRFINILLLGLFVLLLIGILLIPYSFYIIKPLNKIMNSIKDVSEGNLSNPVEVSEKSEFKNLAIAFNNMLFKLKEIMNQKQRLIADVSHELRSPLTRMRISLEILEKDPLGRKNYIKKIISEIESLDKMIQNILDISKLDLDNYSINKKKENIIDLINSYIDKNKLLFESKKIEIIKKFDTDNSLILEIDKVLFDKVLENIFSNSIKYSDDNSQIIIYVKKINNTIQLKIRDFGIGVSKDELEKIFEPFYRTDQSRSKKTGGTGLGLSIVKKIVKQHNAEVFAKIPEDNKGLEIIINFLIDT